MDDTKTRDEADAEPSFDPTRRRLCADGACVGVIGDDGRCRVCGRTEAQAAAGEDSPALAEVDGAPAVDGEIPADGFDAKRRLCDDGACVGVIGDDGACRVCGRRAQ
ncbi:MAG: hypothetical protein JWM82_3239 [Myxococcales bacterium]|nr:hypothetical protein [Myxococcales bacterium]